MINNKIIENMLFSFVVDHLGAFFQQDVTLHKIRRRKVARFHYSPQKM